MPKPTKTMLQKHSIELRQPAIWPWSANLVDCVCVGAVGRPIYNKQCISVCDLNIINHGWF